MGLPSITNVGGSLTSAAALTLLAWAVRFFRAASSAKEAAETGGTRRQHILPEAWQILLLADACCCEAPGA